MDRDFLQHLVDNINNLKFNNKQLKIISKFNKGKLSNISEIVEKINDIDKNEVIREINFLETKGFLWKELLTNKYRISYYAEKRFIIEKRRYLISLI